MPKLEKRNWTKIVSESEGRLIFLPEGFKKAAKEWFDLRSDYNDQVKTMAKKELTLNIALQNLFFELRNYLEKNGHSDIYLKDVGFESGALEDGEFVVSLMDPNKGQLPLR